MSRDSRLRGLRWLLVLPGIALSTLLFLLVYRISCTSIFPTTFLLSFLYEDTHGKVGASALVGTYTGFWATVRTGSRCTATAILRNEPYPA